MNKICLIMVILMVPIGAGAQLLHNNDEKAISPDLFGIFFEDLNYAADGGLYAEMVQNRSFEYSPADQDQWNRGQNVWNPFTAWMFTTRGYGYGTISVETRSPVHINNPHYIVLNAEEPGKEGIGIKNSGFDGMVVRTGEAYDFSVFIRQLSDQPIAIVVKLVDKRDSVIAEAGFETRSKEWELYKAVLTAGMSTDSASLVVLATAKGKLAMDMVSLFPKHTFMNRPNGLRADLAQTIAALHPKFIRFPGGCLVHGDGLGNMYRWKNTIGPVEQRVEQRNIWNYHQTGGLGYFEFFQFCEDIGAKPLPVVPAGVSCQNSGGTWRTGSNGQKCIPLPEMDDYVQEVLDLIEYANGPATSAWGGKRAEAGHPESFHLEYIGIGNEDKQTPEFRERFKRIYDAVKARYPEITVIGTVGPDPSGPDFEQGWKFAKELQVPMVDEHYYKNPDWFLANPARYDAYDRTGPKIYIGEYASWGNTLFNAISEAFYLTSVERNGDVVHMASYAPLLAREGHTQWNPDLIYFNNTSVCPTANYYVQQLFSTNQGEVYFGKVVSRAVADTLTAASCVRDTKTGDVILKLVNAGTHASRMAVDLSRFKGINPNATLSMLTGDPTAKNTFELPSTVLPVTTAYKAGKTFLYDAPAMSLTVIRVKTGK